MDTDAFADPDFRDRLRKLLRLLASDHEQEADTARRMLLAQLAQHNLSAHDLADRLAGPARDQDRVSELRTALRHAEQRAARTEAALRRAESALAQAPRPRSHRGRAARIGLAAVLVALPCAGLALLATTLLQPAPPAPAPAPVRLPPVTARGVQPFAPDPGADRSAMFSTGGAVREVRRPGGWVGTVTFNGTELRETVLPGAAVRATLMAGARVLVFGTITHDGMAWLEVSSDSGPGFVPASRVQKGG